MPYIEDDTFCPLLPFTNAHFNTVWANVVRRISPCSYVRERITTPDSDFLDLDWIARGRKRLVVLSHGLEGSSRSRYIQSLVNQLDTAGYDCVAWNFRGCSGEINSKLRFYHSGATEDLECVVKHVCTRGYQSIFLFGASLGANILLKFLGEEPARGAMYNLSAAACLSAPCDLAASAEQLRRPSNYFYQQLFLRNLKQKLISKHCLFPREIDLSHLSSTRDIVRYDERYTAPLHGFSGAAEYYEKCSARNFIPRITLPTLVLSSKDDPLLCNSSHPIEHSKKSECVTLRLTRYGGHVGFCHQYRAPILWSEHKILEFLNSFS